MKKLIKLLVLAAAIIGFTFSEIKSQNIPKFNGTGYCQDFADVISPNNEKDLNDRLAAIKRETGVEIALVTVTSLEGYDIETYANELFHDWGIGDIKKDNGLLVLLAINDKKSRIEVGYGMEPYITDAISRRILENMKPFLKRGNFYEAYLESINKIQEVYLQSIAISQPETENQISSASKPVSNVKNEPLDLSGLGLFLLLCAAFYPFFILIKWIISRYLNKRKQGLQRKSDFLENLKLLYDEVSLLKEFIGYLNMVDIQNRHESIKLMIEKLKAFSDTQKVESLIEYHNKQTKILIDAAKIIKKQKEDEERKRREEEERKRREEEELARSIKSEKSLKEKAEKMIKLGEMHFVNFFNFYQEKFIKQFPSRKFITQPDFSYFLESIKQEIDNTKGDGKNEISLQLSLNNLEDCTRKIENFYAKSIEDRDNVIRIQEQYKRILDSFENKLGNSEIRKNALFNATDSYEKAVKYILDDNLIDAKQMLNNVHLNINIIEESSKEENKVKSRAFSLGYKIDSTRKLIGNGSTRNLLYQKLDKIYSEIILAFDKNLESIKNLDDMSKIKSDLNLAENFIVDIEKNYKEEEEEKRRRRRQEEEEEERRRRRRQEEEEEERRRSYTSYYSDNSSSSDSGSFSSFGGGDSGGGGASSDW